MRTLLVAFTGLGLLLTPSFGQTDQNEDRKEAPTTTHTAVPTETNHGRKEAPTEITKTKKKRKQRQNDADRPQGDPVRDPSHRDDSSAKN